ncbi:hypothetical protein NFI96_015097 [Prochilodus magdalenae]|nr:hypothetical protein NFI96_015097 [Prochilodus magdalenae]
MECRHLYSVLSDLSLSVYLSPDNVDSVSIKSRSETELTLEWNKVNNINSYRLNYTGIGILINGSEGNPVVTHKVSSLSPGTRYTFTLYTVFEGMNSSGLTFTSVTTPSRVDSVSVKSRNETALTLEWNKVNHSNDYNYTLNYGEKNITISGSEGDSASTVTVSSLSPGTRYNFTLYTLFEGVESSGFTFTSVTTPSSIEGMSIKSRNETALTLEWDKVNNSSDYSYRLNYDKDNITISGSEEDPVVTVTVSSLSPGTRYTFTLYTVFEGVESNGFNFTNVTTPFNVEGVSVQSRSETALTLEWNKVNNINDYNYTLNYNGENITISGSERDSVLTYTVSSLSPGTKYTFTLYTVFEGVGSSGFTFTSVTTPSNVGSVSIKSRNETALTLEWNKVNNINDYNYRLNYDIENITINGSEEDPVVTVTVSSLSPGTKYTFTLYTVFEGVESSEYIFTNVTIPATVTDLHCEYASGGYGLVLVWGPPNGERTSVLVNMNGKKFNESENRLSIGGLQPAQWYTLTVIAESEGEQSNPASITCQTDPRGVIAGVLVFLLLAIICIGIFIWWRKSKLSRLLLHPVY